MPHDQRDERRDDRERGRSGGGHHGGADRGRPGGGGAGGPGRLAGQDDLNRQIAALALAEAADAVGAALQESSDRDALTAAVRAFREFVLDHPGRYAATIGLEPTGPDDPVAVAGARLLDSSRVVLRSCTIRSDEVDHALRAMRSAFHGFASLQDVNGFQWPTDVDESFEWLVTVVDQGLQAMSSPRADDAALPGVTRA